MAAEARHLTQVPRFLGQMEQHARSLSLLACCGRSGLRSLIVAGRA